MGKPFHNLSRAAARRGSTAAAFEGTRHACSTLVPRLPPGTVQPTVRIGSGLLRVDDELFYLESRLMAEYDQALAPMEET